MQTPTLIVADDHPLFRSALIQAVASLVKGAQLIEVEDFEALQRAAQEHPHTDLVLLDLQMPGAQGFSSLLYLRKDHPALPVMIVSGHEEPAIMRRALDFGAAGFVPKSAGLPVLGEAIREVLDGRVWVPPELARRAGESEAAEQAQARRIASLSPQQFRVFMMLAEGRLNKQIAYDIEVTEATVKAHVTAILRKLGLVRRTQAALLAQRLLQTDAPPLRLEAGEGLDGPTDDEA
jgi:DNA-binding NarL/FixJ family response regulator